MLGMANRRDGGYVIIGVESTKRGPIGTEFNPVGLSEEQAASWLDYDDLSSAVNEYASPSVTFEPIRLIHQQREFAIIRVHDFADIPILCTKDYGGSGGRVRGVPAKLRKSSVGGPATSGLVTNPRRLKFRLRRKCGNC